MEIAQNISTSLEFYFERDGALKASMWRQSACQLLCLSWSSPLPSRFCFGLNGAHSSHAHIASWPSIRRYFYDGDRARQGRPPNTHPVSRGTACRETPPARGDASRFPLDDFRHMTDTLIADDELEDPVPAAVTAPLIVARARRARLRVSARPPRSRTGAPLRAALRLC